MSGLKRTAQSANIIDIDVDGVRLPKRRKFHVNAGLIEEKAEYRLSDALNEVFLKVLLTYNSSNSSDELDLNYIRGIGGVMFNSLGNRHMSGDHISCFQF